MAAMKTAAPVLMDLLQAGVDGNVELVASRGEVKPGQLPLNTIPVGVPPVLTDTRERLQNFLLHPEKLPIHDCDRAQRSWKRTPDFSSLYNIDTCPVPTTLSVDRHHTTGKLIGYREEFLEGSGTTAKNSTSLRRLPGPPGESVRGSSTNLPFWPGGLEETNLEALKTNSTEAKELDFDSGLETVPPGLSRGGGFPTKKLGSLFKLENNTPVTTLNIADVISAADDIDLGEDEQTPEQPSTPTVEEDTSGDRAGAKENINDLTEVAPRPEVITLTTEKVQKTDYEWAVGVDIRSPVADFHKRIPDMAYTWPFELDTFQKQAILHLENHDNVFVAAHTSAGKTVVAEYAIALSMRHMTRTIYTSPIKALSNQKFRDFKTTFEDVGLITGDVQLRQEAACLIMTTEILRSMLYNGSDVIRDLEWVIFDEVHYINDADRGVVWEEVLIMLPQHVNIILLSATVPNTMEFADWVGRTKQRKVYVVSTQKRPVPLEHYLYTGNSSKTSKELFKIVDSSKQFLTGGYSKAIEAKKERSSKSSQNFGPRGTRGGHPNQDKNVWLSVIEMLRKQDKLPIVAFTFSKKKINENANALHSLDLTTSTEKSEVHVFFQKCISRLKAPDRELPQVKELSGHLKRGIGIHHSGVLPILKEVVEMLFQRGLVKILFATETFAMGVNMPARTVVFDSIRKHDGMQFRDLLPGEYIQMAGRAGRRGLDTTGTVIILVKGDVPETSDLNRMMLGKPTLLSSQFRLTYSMILNLLRVEQLRVEDMMRRSFSEFHNQKDSTKHEEALKILDQKIAELPEVVDYMGDLEAYYLACRDYQELRVYLQKVVLSHPVAIKCLSPGRVVVIDTNQHPNTLGVVLQQGSTTSSAGKERTFTVLVICEQDDQSGAQVTDTGTGDWSMPRPVTDDELFHPDGPCGQKVVTVGSEGISVITTKALKVNADRIIDDVNKRKIPRFRNDAPSQSTSVATQELLRLVEEAPRGLPGIDPIKDLHLRDLHLVEEFQKLDKLRKSFSDYKCVQDPGFLDNYKQVAVVMKMKDEHKYLKFLLSEESLQLLPEYQQRVQVLKELQYVDKLSTVQLKGRVACEISNHELLITELILENALTDMPPEQIAAVMSCVVFEQRNCSEPSLTPALIQARETVLAAARKIGVLQKECGLKMPVEDFVDQYHFGLVEVVFEWARGLPFKEITELTDVQEGIIVRSIQRLDEVLRDVRNAARIIGDPVLYQKMENASMLIKRDIVFAASLYTQ